MFIGLVNKSCALYKWLCFFVHLTVMKKLFVANRTKTYWYILLKAKLNKIFLYKICIYRYCDYTCLSSSRECTREPLSDLWSNSKEIVKPFGEIYCVPLHLRKKTIPLM